jgi:mannose-6-phosphate isomerase-like protein (cupin superfamily)
MYFRISGISIEMWCVVDTMSTDTEYPTIRAPQSGKRVRYLETADDTDGEYARFEMWLDGASQSHGPMKHVHPEQDEALAVRDGVLGVWHDSETHRLSAGESHTIPAGDPHQFWNAGDDEVRVVGEVRPALQTEAFMYITYGLNGDVPVTPSGMPINPLRLAPVIDEFDNLLYLSMIPIWIQKIGVQAVAPFGRLLGYDSDYPEYIPDERTRCLNTS